MQHYLVTMMLECNSCEASSTTSPNRRVSLSLLNKQFMMLYVLTMFSGYFSSTSYYGPVVRFSSGVVVESTSMEEGIYVMY